MKDICGFGLCDDVGMGLRFRRLGFRVFGCEQRRWAFSPCRRLLAGLRVGGLVEGYPQHSIQHIAPACLNSSLLGCS